VPLEVQYRTIELLEAALGRRIYVDRTPTWLLRPGREEFGPAWRKIRLIYRRLTNGMELPATMPLRERRSVDGVLGGRGIPFRIVEVDESQHFNPFRAQTLALYPETPVAFPRRVWLRESRTRRAKGGGGWSARKPPLFPMEGGRHRQRAFRDAIADLLPPQFGWAPTLRVADFEVRGWMYDRNAVSRMRRLVEERLVQPSDPDDLGADVHSEVSNG
jgi:hypothetical protein